MPMLILHKGKQVSQSVGYLVQCATSSLLGESGKEERKEEKSLSNGAERWRPPARPSARYGDVLVNNACIGDSV